MKAILKNFLNVLTRFKVASFLNVAGLSVALASFLIIMMQVKYEWTFDKIHRNSNRIFRVDMPRSLSGDMYASVLTRGFADKVLESSPNIEAGTLLNLFTGSKYITVGEEDSQKGFMENIVTCYPDIVKIFDFFMVEGDINSLNDPEKILIPESLARRMFNNDPAVGKIVHAEEGIWTKGDIQTFTIGGVYKDFPENTQLNNVIYTAMDNKTQKDDWYSQNYFAYVLLDRAESKDIVEESINAAIDYEEYGKPAETRMELMPLTDIYYMPGQLTDFVKSGNPNTTKLLFLIAILIIVIACINFINFSTALAPVRMKSINTQKVLGSSVGSLRATLIFEAVGTTLLACLFALLIVWILGQTQILSFIFAEINIFANMPLAILLLVLAILLGFVSGSYPSWYMTSFSPALVLKGNFGLSASGRKLRTILISFQYIVSIGLIICALFIQLQNKYMRTYDLGFRKDQIAIVNLGSKLYKESGDIYTKKLKEYPGIEAVAFATHAIGQSDSYSSYDMHYKDQRFNTTVIEVSYNFLDVMDIHVIDGRNFTESDAKNDSTTYYVYDRKIQEMFNMQSGDLLDQSWRGREYISGFINPVKLTSLRQSEDYVAFKMNGKQVLPVSYIRLSAGANIPEAVQHIKETIANIDPSYPFTIDFYDTFFEHLYKKEESLNKMVASFSLLAIILSIVGVFGLVVFETQYRRKEIGVRKVFGATVGNILVMFNRIYIRIVSVCFIIAAPVAYYFVTKWLQSFHYRTPIYWWVFFIAFILVTLITLFTVSFQNWRAANANPVESIKTE